MPYKNIEDRRARLKELRKRHPDKEYKAYKEKVLKICSLEKQEHYKRLWAKKELPQRKLEIIIKALEFYSHPSQWSKMGFGAYSDIGHLAREALQEIKELE